MRYLKIRTETVIKYIVLGLKGNAKSVIHLIMKINLLTVSVRFYWCFIKSHSYFISEDSSEFIWFVQVSNQASSDIIHSIYLKKCREDSF